MADLYFGDAVATDAEIEAVAAVVASAGGPARVELDDRVVIGGTARRADRRRHLLPGLHALQAAIGWVSPGGLNHLAKQLQVPPAEAFGVASFYHLLATDERSGDRVHVCDDIACRNNGAEATIETLRGEGLDAVPSPCLGQCESGSAAFLQCVGRPDVAVAPATPVSIRAALESGTHDVVEPSAASAPVPQLGDDSLRLLGRVGVVDPTSLDAYRASGGYEALDAAIAMGAAQVVEEVAASGLMGRGGAAFPTGIKWRAVAAEEGRPHHLIANADESEPGTFKDRVIMEFDPFSLVEAMTVAGFAIGAEQGWLYVRGEYPLAIERLQGAIDAARAAGLLGSDVAGAGFAFDIEIRKGGGAYICGEETALMNSIEGYRGEPRNKPPFPTTHGLFQEPTAINNVETLVNVLEVVRLGGAGFAEIGTERSTGPKLFCLSGAVQRPGVYEVTFGATLREVIDLAGGLPEGRQIQAVLLGGAAGVFCGPESLDIALTLEAVREAGLTLGSGVIMVFDETVDLNDTIRRITQFFRDESCGQCVPCRVGAVRQDEAVVRLGQRPAAADRELLLELEQVMRDASICGLGQTAGSAVKSALALGLIGGDA